MEESKKAVLIDKTTFYWSSAVVGMLIGAAFWFGNEYARWVALKDIDIPGQLWTLKNDAEKIKSDLAQIKVFIGLRDRAAESSTTGQPTSLRLPLPK